MPKPKRQRSLTAWGKQKWRTKSGKKSSETGERYLPTAAIKAMSPSEYARTTAAKRKRGEKMRKKGAKGAPTAAQFKRAKQTARKNK